MFFLEVGYKIKKKRRGGMSMRKKMKLFIAMVSVGVLLGTIPVMAAEQPELPTKVQDIANGSDVSDLNEPHHASNLTAVNSNHSAFEKYVDKNRKSYTIAGNSFNSSVYTTALNTSTGDLMYSAAKHAKGLAANAQNESTYDSAGRRSVQHAIQTVTQYMYKFGKEVGIY